MHESSYKAMEEAISVLDKNNPLKILDVGSFDVCGSYKPLFDFPQWQYVGLDIIEGPNVDLVVDPYEWAVEDCSYDVVISGQCLEHVEMPWRWIMDVERVCKRGGLIIIIVPWNCHIHRHPVDCWRVLPDGLKVLCTKCADLDLQRCDAINCSDVLAIARKK